MQILISIETYITCDFSGVGGGGSGPPIPLWIRAWVRNKQLPTSPLPCHGLRFLKVSEGLPAGAVGNMSDYCFFLFFFRGWGGANAYFQRNLKNL